MALAGHCHQHPRMPCQNHASQKSEIVITLATLSYVCVTVIIDNYLYKIVYSHAIVLQ